jgi:hypothetical protein
MKSILFLLLFAVFLVSCKKPEDRKCAKATGEETSLEIPLDTFDKLYLHEHLVYELIQDSTDKVVLTGGKNLLNHVAVNVSDGLLDISNENRCSFLRSYKKKIKAEIHFTSLINIHFEGTEPLTNKDILKFDWLTFLIRDGAGSVSLNMDAQQIYATISHGWGDFAFTGNVQYANLNIRSNGYCDLFGMNISDSVTVVSNTQGDVKISAQGIKLKAQTLSDGDIYYKGAPSLIEFDKISNGELIKVN